MKQLEQRIMLTALLLLSVIGVNAEVLTGKCGENLTYMLDTDTGVLKIEGSGNMTNYSHDSTPWNSNRERIIRVEIADGVTSIGNAAFYFCTGLTSQTIPNSVTSIGEWAFYGCSGLTTVKIPNSVESIGDRAFYGCKALTSVDIPNSVKSIGGSAFWGCSSLEYVTISNSVISIGDWAFDGCTRLRKPIIVNDMFVKLPVSYSGYYTIPSGITTIIGGAFRGCNSLVTVTIPNSMTSIAGNAFSMCSSLMSVTIPNSVTSIGYRAFAGCSGFKSVKIPDSVTSISEMAFQNCTHLNKVELGKNVAQLGSDAFKGCGIKEFYVTGEEAPYCYPGVFADVALNNATLYAPSERTSYYKTTAPWNEFGKLLTLEGNEPPSAKQCAAPVITFSNGKVTCTSETEGATCIITCSTSCNTNGKDEMAINPQLTVTAVAKAEGYADSEPVTETFVLGTGSDLPGDINNDGRLSVTDIVNIAEKILNGETE